MAEFTLVIDHDKCTGCGVCEMVCAMHSGHGFNPQKARIRVIALEGETALSYLPVTCMQCEKPPCEAICPTGAISSDPVTGAKVINKEKCIGCSGCVYACPFGAIVLDRSEKIPFVCDHCGGDPLCAQWCPQGAIEYIKSDSASIRLKRERADKFIGNIDPQFIDAKKDPYVRLIDSLNK